MSLDYLSELSINQFIALSLAEDIGEGDHTTDACVPANATESAYLLLKGNGVMAGMNIAERILLHLDASLQFKKKINDGQVFEKGAIGFEITGNARAILKGERLLLNCMQRMSGIATLTKQYADKIKHTNTTLLDTRKTTPGFRLMEKWAVAIGGGKNHRYNLAEMVMIKDNHIAYTGGIEPAILSTHRYLATKRLALAIEIETRTIEEVKEVCRVGQIDRILLDNMAPDMLREALAIINGQFETEASGGITEKTIVAKAETGVNFISVGALTHSAASIDMSLEVK